MTERGSAAIPPCHRLPLTQLDSLAAGRFDAQAISTLHAAERSRRLLLLRAMVDQARSRIGAIGPLASVDAAWELLLRAERANPHAVAEMIGYPQTGTWIAHTLRRIREVTSDPQPLWCHVGQLHTFAIAAAARAHLTATLTVPVSHGHVALPSVGSVRLPHGPAWGHAEALLDNDILRLRAGTITVEVAPQSESASDIWHPLRRLRTTSGGQDLTVRLDDLSGYRTVAGPMPPAPLPDTEAASWQALLDDAWKLLAVDHPHAAQSLAAGLACVVPSATRHRFRLYSASVEDGFGTAILAKPHDAAELAVTLVHEFQHSLLNGLRHLVVLSEGDDSATGYAPWRDEPRPLGGLIHGVFAFAAVAEFWSIQRTWLTGAAADFANFEFALWRRQTRAVLRSVRHRPAVTSAGARLLDGIAERLDRLLAQSIPKAALRTAEAAASDHFAAWRACHVVPDQDLVHALTDAWLADRPTPPIISGADATVQVAAVAQRLDAKAVLTRIRLIDPTLFAQLRAEPAHIPEQVAGATAADVAWAASEPTRAARLYRAELAETTDRAAAWSGLGLVLTDLGQREPADMLLRRPELVRAVSTSVTETTGTRPEPDGLARWLSRCPT